MFIRFSLFLITLVACSYQAHPVEGSNTDGLYESTFALNLTMPNADISAQMIGELVSMSLEYTVISNGVESYVRILQAAPEDNQLLTVHSNEVYAYTDCKLGIGVTLDDKNNVLMAFAIREYDFEPTKQQAVNVSGREMNCNVFSVVGQQQMTLFTSATLPSAVSLGSCLNGPINEGIVRMIGSNKKTTIEAVLIDYKRASFDFSEYKKLASGYDRSKLSVSNIFW